MEHAERIATTEQNLALIVEAVASGPLDVTVPSCPGMTVDDLAAHLGEHCGFWTHVLCEATGRPRTPFAPEPGAEGRAEWLRALGDHLVAQLRATTAGTEVWTYYEPDRTAGFVGRRTCHELTVHRVDLQLARGAAEPIDPALAVDGIDEMLDVLIPTRPDLGDRLAATAGETLHLHGTDHEPAESLVTLAPDGFRVEREHAKGDLALRGHVADIEMLLYQRPPWGELQRFGDESVLSVFHRVFTF